MNNRIHLMHQVWDSLVISNRRPTATPPLPFGEVLSSVFSLGSFYFYVVDFFDQSVSGVSDGFAAAHGIPSEDVKHINDVLGLIHPDDMHFVSESEKTAFEFINRTIGIEKITSYKVSYNFRFKNAGDEYRMYNHQSLVLTVDENGNFAKALNIHTDISHLTSTNNFRLSLIGMGEEPSYLNMPVIHDGEKALLPATGNKFSRRELEIIRLLSEGNHTRAISQKLCISEFTVKTNRKNISKKSGCKNTMELIARSMAEGWV